MPHMLKFGKTPNLKFPYGVNVNSILIHHFALFGVDVLKRNCHNLQVKLG